MPRLPTSATITIYKKAVSRGNTPLLTVFIANCIKIIAYKSKKNHIRTHLLYPNNGSNLAGAQGLEFPLIQYFTSRNAVFSPLRTETFTIS